MGGAEPRPVDRNRPPSALLQGQQQFARHRPAGPVAVHHQNRPARRGAIVAPPDHFETIWANGEPCGLDRGIEEAGRAVDGARKGSQRLDLDDQPGQFGRGLHLQIGIDEFELLFYDSGTDSGGNRRLLTRSAGADQKRELCLPRRDLEHLGQQRGAVGVFGENAEGGGDDGADEGRHVGLPDPAGSLHQRRPDGAMGNAETRGGSPAAAGNDNGDDGPLLEAGQPKAAHGVFERAFVRGTAGNQDEAVRRCRFQGGAHMLRQIPVGGLGNR